MNILLVNITPPLKHGLFPLGIAYLKAMVNSDEELKGKVDFFVANIAFKNAEERILAMLEGNNYDLVGFAGYVWNISKVDYIAKHLKQNGIKIPIVIGGPEASYDPGSFLSKYPHFDIAICGEGEETFLELVKTMNFNLGSDHFKDMDKINGLAYNNGSIRVNPERFPMDLDILPSPYLENDSMMDDYTYFPIETHRGCPFKCYFCFYNKNFSKVRYFSLEKIENELKFLFSRNITKLYIMDPTFNIDLKRAKKICELIIKYNKKNIPIHTEIRAELVDEEFAELLKEANITRVEVGLQSINEGVLDLINRSYNKETFLDGINLLKKYDIELDISIIIGLPGDTLSSFLRTYAFVESLNPEILSAFIFQVLPGTHIYRNADKFCVRFVSEPPYRIIETDTFSKEEIKQAEEMHRQKNLLKKNSGSI